MNWINGIWMELMNFQAVLVLGWTSAGRERCRAGSDCLWIWCWPEIAVPPCASYLFVSDLLKWDCEAMCFSMSYDFDQQTKWFGEAFQFSPGHWGDRAGGQEVCRPSMSTWRVRKKRRYCIPLHVNRIYWNKKLIHTIHIYSCFIYTYYMLYLFHFSAVARVESVWSQD